MFVLIVNVRLGEMTMLLCRMGMKVAVRFFPVAMLVVCIMDMAVFVFQWFVPVGVLVSFRHMQPRAKSHRDSRDQQLGRQAIAQH